MGIFEGFDENFEVIDGILEEFDENFEIFEDFRGFSIDFLGFLVDFEDFGGFSMDFLRFLDFSMNFCESCKEFLVCWKISDGFFNYL